MAGKKTIKVIVVEPGGVAEVREIPSGLESYQKMVGGWIECIYPFDDQVGIICNEEGKLNGMPLNRALRDEDGDIYDIIAGTFLIVGLTATDFRSLKNDELQKYLKKFLIPEAFLKVDNRIVAIPMV